MTVISSNVGKNPLEEMEQSPQSIKDSKMKKEKKKDSQMQYLVQFQKWQNDLGLFPRQTIQHHSNISMPQAMMQKKLKLTGSVKTYKTF